MDVIPVHIQFCCVLLTYLALLDGINSERSYWSGNHSHAMPADSCKCTSWLHQDRCPHVDREHWRIRLYLKSYSILMVHTHINIAENTDGNSVSNFWSIPSLTSANWDFPSGSQILFINHSHHKTIIESNTCYSILEDFDLIVDLQLKFNT